MHNDAAFNKFVFVQKCFSFAAFLNQWVQPDH